MSSASPPVFPFSPAVLAAAPHRLLFFVGALNVLAAMFWWTLWLFDPVPMPVNWVMGGWLHGFMLQYQMLPSFMFGFLITVFPRWMGQPEATRWHYVPVGVGLLMGQVSCLVAAFSGSAVALRLGVGLTLLGWGWGLAVLGHGLLRDRFRTWHAVSCCVALAIGFAAVGGFAWYLHGFDLRVGQAAMRLGAFGVLLPVYATVAHRMFPFFAANVVAGYRAWRPLWLLAAQWPLWLAHVGLELAQATAWMWLSDLPLLALSLVCLWHWWPRGPMPALLRVLFLGYAWLPVALALYAFQSLWLLLAGEWVMGRAPLHALAVGMFGSLLVAMVTRVTQGHSGRPLVLGRVALIAFVGIQIAAVTRVAAELMASPYTGFRMAAAGWILAFLPWVIRSAWIYLRPRADGKPG
ncbi:NnrS family protein [Xanthomonadaceae bacterium JHOS43]|nr:NnrS family protein [Xanthomonadaceae bacterium JHOS43]